MSDALSVTVVLLFLGLLGVAWFGLRGSFERRGTPTERATLRALRTANLAAPVLRAGLDADSAAGAVPLLRALLGGRGMVLADRTGILAADHVDAEHLDLVTGVLRQALTGRAQVEAGLPCSGGAACHFQAVVAVPVQVDGEPVATLAVLSPTASPSLGRLATEVAKLVGTQLELAELDHSRRRAELAELRFLRAQISPHFVYNALTAIASYVRTDPGRARDLLLGFADFTRDSLRDHAPFATVAEELRLVDTYLELEQARFGDQLSVTVTVAPDALGVIVPSLTLQPIVENAVRHGLEPREGRGHLRISITADGDEARIVVEDDGVGADPCSIRRILAGAGSDDQVGLHNVDWRLRSAFGEDHGLVVRTRPGAGTTVAVRAPVRGATEPCSAGTSPRVAAQAGVP